MTEIIVAKKKSNKKNVFEAETFWPGIDVTLFRGQYDYDIVVLDPFSIIRSEKYTKNTNLYMYVGKKYMWT